MMKLVQAVAVAAAFSAGAALISLSALAQGRTYAEPYPYHKSSGAKGYQVYPTSGCEDFKATGGTTRQICNGRHDTRDAKQYFEYQDFYGPNQAK